MQLVTVQQKVTREELQSLANEIFGNLVKAVVDVEKEIMLINAEMHADEEAELIKNGSKQINLWGINLYPELDDENFLEFDSMINLRPTQGNKTRGVDNEDLQYKIRQIVAKLVTQ